MESLTLVTFQAFLLVYAPEMSNARRTPGLKCTAPIKTRENVEKKYILYLPTLVGPYWEKRTFRLS